MRNLHGASIAVNVPTPANYNAHWCSCSWGYQGRRFNVCLVTEQWILLKETRYFLSCTGRRAVSKKNTPPKRQILLPETF